MEEMIVRMLLDTPYWNAQMFRSIGLGSASLFGSAHECQNSLAQIWESEMGLSQ